MVKLGSECKSEFNENEKIAVSGFVMVSETCSGGKICLYSGALSVTELI
jgi:hypothetical protein